MKKSFQLKEIKPNIFCLEFNNYYDMCMTFLRYQEYYESPSNQFRGKSFRILDFMKWYSSKFGNGSFTYTIDWSGFNFHGDIIKEVRDLGIPDPNEYDTIMWKTYQYCHKKANGQKFYIIGLTKNDGSTVNHEVAHGFFYLNISYKKQMTSLVKAMAPELRETMNTYLHKKGYAPKVYMDETHAYMAAAENFNEDIGFHFTADMAAKLTEAQQPFIEVFNRYNIMRDNYFSQ